MTSESGDFSAERFLASIGASIDGFMYRGLNSSDYAMVWLSSGFDALTGYDRTTFIRERAAFAGLIHPDDLPKVDAAVADALARRGNWQVSYRLRRRDGVETYVHESGGGAEWDPATGKPAFLDGIIMEAEAMSALAGRLSEGVIAVDNVGSAAGSIVKTLKTLRLLALNARIEAARASHHGAGFGVVAQEMVSLADTGEEVTGRIEEELSRLRAAVRF